VGPRPAIDYELEHYEPEHYERFEVRPGLTGLWQVSGRSRLGFTEMLELDAEYARTTSPLLDARILARTPLEILRGRAS
jgi:lipopolysaccharide/colanic/teichoic acid biosynthesis glycosyltransferase